MGNDVTHNRFGARTPLLALSAIAALALAAGGCGAANKQTKSTAFKDKARPAPAWLSAATSYTGVDGDKDNDFGSPDTDKHHEPLNFGPAADAADKRAIVALVERYYAAAFADDGAKACSMIYSTLAESTPEDYAVPGGPEYLRGATTCQAVAARLFHHFHAVLGLEVPKLVVSHVLVKEHQGMALLSFVALPEREIPVTREGHFWRIGALLDRELP